MSFYDKVGTSAVGQNHRRTWDTAEFEARANERIRLEKELEDLQNKQANGTAEPGPKRDMLKARDYKVDLESKVGRSVVINKTTPSAESGGYYCDVCDCVVKDSINFLDHINGKNHQRNMGMNMKVKRSTVDDVRARFAFKKQENEKKKREVEIEERLEELKEEEARMADYKQQKKQERKRKREPQAADEEYGDEGAELDPEMAAMMGFGGFGSSKKK